MKTTSIIEGCARQAKADRKHFLVTVLANVGEYSLVRNKKGELYYIQETLPVDTEVEVTYGEKRNRGCKGILGLLPTIYAASHDSEGFRAKIRRRLNEKFLLCSTYELGQFLVVCSEEDQQKLQKEISLVVGIKSDGNDRQFLKCENILEIKVLPTESVLHLYKCKRA